MDAMAESEALVGGCDELVSMLVTWLLSQLKESVSVVLSCIGVDRLVLVDGLCGNGDHSTLGDETAIGKCNILEGETVEGG